MASRAHPGYTVVFVLVVAPIGAVVAVAALLLFGVRPHAVFAAGFALISFLQTEGFHPPKAVGVLTTVGVWWLGIVVVGLALDRWRTGKAS